MNEQITKLFHNLEKNKMQPLYAETKEDAVKIVKDMLFDGCVITWGGSMSVIECGIDSILKNEKYCFMDRGREGISPKEQQECFKASIGADFFFCSANAITEKGELLNVDGLANRTVSPSHFLFTDRYRVPSPSVISHVRDFICPLFHSLASQSVENSCFSPALSIKIKETSAS